MTVMPLLRIAAIIPLLEEETRRPMANPRSILIAGVLALIVATPAWAQKQRFFGGPQPGRPHFVNSAQGRPVEVISVGPMTESPSMPTAQEAEEIDSPELAPVPEGEFDVDYGMQEDCTSPSCSVTGCEQCGPCGQCGLCDCDCTPFWAHRTYVFGEYMYLQPMGVDMAYAFQQDGVGGTGTVPAGRVGVVNQDFTSGFRAGFAKKLTPCASIGASYWSFFSSGSDVIEAPSGLDGTVQSLVLHPGNNNEGTTGSLAQANYDIDFRLIDIDYRRILDGGDRGAVNFVVGARYGKLQQDFQTLIDFAQPVGTIVNTTTIQYEGVGLRTGLDGERRIGCSRLSAYGKGFINVLFGTFNTSYTQVNTTFTTVQAQSNWRDGRTVPILEYELGISWTSARGHWRLSTGYYTAFWFNAITTPQYVQAVQNANFVNLGDTISFDGVVSRCEFRF
jgi:Legionella pneumophila major outer membrane protein precursor